MSGMTRMSTGLPTGITGGNARRPRRAVRPASPLLFVVVLTTLGGCNSVASVPPRPLPITVANSFVAYAHPVWTPDGQHLYFNYRPIARISEEPPGSGVYYYFDAESLDGIYRFDLPTGLQHRGWWYHSPPILRCRMARNLPPWVCRLPQGCRCRWARGRSSGRFGWGYLVLISYMMCRAHWAG